MFFANIAIIIIKESKWIIYLMKILSYLYSLKLDRTFL